MSIRHDPIEDDPAYRELIAAVEEEARRALAARGFKPPMFGYCHLFWNEKRALLEERHGIAWRSPDDLNPGVCFD